MENWCNTIDSESIILEVQKHPCIYDSKNQFYKDADFKKESWLDITMSVVGEKWDEFDNEKKREANKEVKKRWKSIKDGYFKNIRLREAKSSETSKRRRPYLYCKQLSFLQSSPQPKRTSSSMNDNEINNTSESSKSDTPQMTKSSRLPSKRKADDFEKEIDNTLQANNDCLRPIAQKEPERGPDEMFLLSQLPVIKRMKPSAKLEFQIQFLKLLKLHSETD